MTFKFSTTYKLSTFLFSTLSKTIFYQILFNILFEKLPTTENSLQILSYKGLQEFSTVSTPPTTTTV